MVQIQCSQQNAFVTLETLPECVTYKSFQHYALLRIGFVKILKESERSENQTLPVNNTWYVYSKICLLFFSEEHTAKKLKYVI